MQGISQSIGQVDFFFVVISKNSKIQIWNLEILEIL